MFLTGADTPLQVLLAGCGDAGAPTGSSVLQDQTTSTIRTADARLRGGIYWPNTQSSLEGKHVPLRRHQGNIFTTSEKTT